jgi:hypothetical protein
MEMAVIATVLFLLRSVPGRVAAPVVAALCLVQVFTYHRYAASQTRPVDIRATVEYRMAKWFEDHIDGRRVFAPGSVAVWMNAFVDTPQLIGCCGQSVPSFEQSIAGFTIYSDLNAGNRDAEVSLLWLKAYGVSAIGVTGPRSTEFYKPYAHPHKFDGALPELWRDGDDVVYNVPGRSASLAHVILPEQEIRRVPVNGLDVDPLRLYVAALDDPALPVAEMQWVNSHHIRISAPITPPQEISVQMSYVPGWRASANGVRAAVHADAIGQVVIEPRCNGPCTIDLAYEGVPEARWLRIAQIIGALAAIVWTIFSPAKPAS